MKEEINKIYKVYSLTTRENITNIRYIGITKTSLKNRLSAHISSAKKKDDYRARWIRKNKIQINELDSTDSLEKVLNLERYYIKLYKSLGFKLTNASSGGEGKEGFKCSEDTKNKISKANLGKKRTEEEKLKMRIAHLGKESLKKKKVLQYDLNNNFIKEWESMSEAGLKCKIPVSSISLCCNNKQSVSCGFKWKFKK